MTDTRAMLEASPTDVPLDVTDVAAAIDACLNCVQACTGCADADLAEQDVEGLRTCIALDQDCADVCDLMARALSRPAHWDHLVVHRLLQACVRVCTACAEECARHADHHRHCAICEKACRACARACDDLLEAEAFKELQKLAGG
jgi:uncharacterized membrane protein